ncbi:MAG TPA: TolC family protein, partial [Opitutales bacterium]|nr:TolC family protein [Opitutales bacterium]
DQLALTDRSDVDRVVYFAGIELTLNLFDGYETRGRKKAAIARRDLETRRYEREKEEESVERQRLKESLLWSSRELEIAEKRLELAYREVAQKESDLESGTASSVDVAAARVALLERELAATEQRATQLLLASEFLSRTGNGPAMKFLKQGNGSR